MSAPTSLWTETQALVEAMPVGVFRIHLDLPREFAFGNEALARMLEYPTEKIVGLSLNDVFSQVEFLPLFESVVQHGRAQSSRIEVLTRSKMSLFCSLTMVLVKDAKHKNRFVDGVLQDLSAQHRADKDLKESKELFNSIFLNSATAILVADQSGMVTAWNPFALDMLGMEKIDLFNKPMTELFPLREWDRVVKLREKQKDKISEITGQIYKKDSSVLDVGLSISLIKNPENRIIGTVVVLRDITQQKAAERKIRESESKIRIILDHSAAAMTLTDDQERIITWNKFAEKLLGRAKEDLYLKPVSSLYPPEEWEKIRSANIRKAGSQQHLETKIVKGDGSVVDVDLSVTVLKDSNDKVVGSVGILQDITEQKKNKEMLVKAKTLAEEANTTKSLFLANMSHEFRTPMNTILGLLDLTLDTPLTPEQRDNMLTIKNAGDGLLNLLNDILDLSKVESGKLQLENIEVNLGNVVQSVCKGLQVLAKNKNLELVWDIDPAIPEVVIGDPVRIRQILVNLINNAIKFTFRGQVTTQVKLLGTENGVSHLQFSVKDQGVGIPKDKLDAIFEAFTQADASTTRRFGGTGLGLSISKKLVEMMGGKIWVESEEFQGSTFFFTAKLANGQPKTKPETSQTATVDAAVNVQNLRILLAEDNVVNQKMAAKMLEKRGWFVKGAENGKQVLEYLDQEQFDLILMDAQMPVLDGFEATRLIREAEKNSGRHIPIIALTAHAMAGDRQRCIDAGMDNYVSKPIDRLKLYETIEQTITQQKR